MTDPLAVTARVSIPREELVVRASRAGGPGGQHVNTSSTRIEVRWNARLTRAVDEAQRDQLLARLGARVDADGWVRVVASEHRSQRRNREAAEGRLAALVRRALAVPRRRVPTRPPRAAAEARLAAKRRRSERKRERGERGDD